MSNLFDVELFIILINSESKYYRLSADLNNFNLLLLSSYYLSLYPLKGGGLGGDVLFS